MQPTVDTENHHLKDFGLKTQSFGDTAKCVEFLTLTIDATDRYYGTIEFQFHTERVYNTK